MAILSSANRKRRLITDNRVRDRYCIRTYIMKIFIGLFIILSNEALNGGNAGKEHVHFKIHVPQIIKHHIHTKTVFVHIHKPKKSKIKEEVPTKTYHKETHQDWSSWNAYDYHDNDNNLSKDHNGIHKEEPQKQKENPFFQDPKDSYMPMSQHHNKPDHLKGKYGDMIGYSYPPQYAVHENVKETDDNNIDMPYMHTYEEGYRKGGESARGHIYTGDVTKFYDGKHEEGDHSIDEEYKNESTEKTHAGRYFIDDNEYHHDNDKYKNNTKITQEITILYIHTHCAESMCQGFKRGDNGGM
ncbi:uncharacterized protein [Anoplolepis gracilipes]|uniref:uncharacterized protein n=1 Tax=Anoplolepis gracilipes TaxID=354296 RepID=UPI003BA28B6E